MVWCRSSAGVLCAYKALWNTYIYSATLKLNWLLPILRTHCNHDASLKRKVYKDVFMLQCRALDWLLVKDWRNSTIINGLSVVVEVISHIANDDNIHAHERDVDQSCSRADPASSEDIELLASKSLWKEGYLSKAWWLHGIKRRVCYKDHRFYIFLPVFK